MKEYGEAAKSQSDTYFNLNYNGATNSCIDFTWKGLGHAGLHMQIYGNAGLQEITNYEGSFKPVSNVRDFDSIHTPFPSSPLNRRQINPLPADRTILQKLLTENDALSPDKQKFAMQTAKAVEALQQREPRLAGLNPGQVDNLSASLASSGWRGGMDKADGAALSAADPGKAMLISRIGEQKVRHASVDVGSAVQQPAAASLAALAAAPEKASAAPVQAIKTASRSSAGMNMG
ncbi:XVIPCD domain-containing protein [Chromobacterium sphagni]|nr:XVIPCD domain-containing protein [Chromobacterium sphagni]